MDNKSPTKTCSCCGGERGKGGGRGMCKRCYEGVGSGNKCELCGAAISRRAARCEQCSLKGKAKSHEHKLRLSQAKRNHRWARDWDCCQECGTTERRHCIGGLCVRCRSRQLQRKQRSEHRTPKTIVLYRTYDWLVEHYVRRGLTIDQCAAVAGTRRSTISRWLHKHNILVDEYRWHRGRKLSLETKLRIGMKNSGKHAPMYGRRGPTAPRWMGGKSFEPYTPDFTDELKQIIRKRDKACVLCGACNGTLHVHHINYDKHNCSPTNLVALCNSCHSRTNSNRTNWQKHFEQYVSKIYE